MMHRPCNESEPPHMMQSPCNQSDPHQHLLCVPTEIMGLILQHGTGMEHFALLCCCRGLRETLGDLDPWKHALCQKYRTVIDSPIFRGELPQPLPGHSWRDQFHLFERNWLQATRSLSGRVLLRMRSECTAVAPSANSMWQYVPGFQGPIPAALVPSRARQPGCETYVLCDATDFVSEHPGAATLLLDAASEDDSTCLFESVMHSSAAREMLRRLVVLVEATDFRRRAHKRSCVDIGQELLPVVISTCVLLLAANALDPIGCLVCI